MKLCKIILSIIIIFAVKQTRFDAFINENYFLNTHINMQTSLEQIKRLTQYEQFSPVAICDDDKKTSRVEYSIGYGHQIQPHEEYLMTATITREQAEELRRNDLAKQIEPWVNKFCTHLNNVTQNQYDALVDICYNCGPGVLQKDAVFKMIIEGATKEEIEKQWKQTRVHGWDDNKKQFVELAGLKTRRAKEVELFFS